jgi:phospholipid transport system substrate-binding protein
MVTFRVARRAVLTALLATGVPGTAVADSPVEPIRRLVDGLLRTMRLGQAAPFQRRFDDLAPVVDRVFDLLAIVRASVGTIWPALPAHEQSVLQQAFRRYTVASYVNSFDTFAGQRFGIGPDIRSLPNGDAVVHTTITPATGDSHSLDYVMRQQVGNWRAVDVLADGAISRVAVQRSDFRRLLMHGGAAALAANLQD